MRRSVRNKDWFTIFNVKVTARACISKIWLFTTSSKLLVRLQPNLVWEYSIISRNVPWKRNYYCVQGQGRSEDSKCQWMFVRMISFEPQNILLPNFVWWCSIMSLSVMLKKKQVCYRQSQGHSDGLYDQNTTLSAVSSELMILRQPDLVWRYIIISQSVLRKINWSLHSR